MGWESSLENTIDLDMQCPNMMLMLILPEGIAGFRLISQTYLKIGPRSLNTHLNVYFVLLAS